MPRPSSSAGIAFGRRNRGWRTALALLLALVLSACATPGIGPSETQHQQTLGRVAVVATEQMPELGFEGFAHGMGEGAAIGAGQTFAGCLGGMGGGHCSGSACGAALILLIGICGIFGLIGGVAGAATAPSMAEAAAGEGTLARAFEVRTIQQSVRHAVEDAAKAAGVTLVELPEEAVRSEAATGDYRLLAGLGVDTVLETSLIKAGTSGYGINNPTMAFMQVRVRLIDTTTNSERFATDYIYNGRRLDLAGWSANQGQPLLDELETGYLRLGTHIYENVFERYPFPDQGFHSAGGMLSVSFGLAPIRPPTRGSLTGDDSFLGARFEWFATDGLQPHLEWQAFPRPSDIAAAPDDMARVRNVTYDLLIAREENMAPAQIVYRRDGLPQPEHAIAIMLRPESRYFWTVRARFELDGRSRVTEWGVTHYAAREKITAPSRFSYRFRTPGLR